jgi:peptidoglycan hydrolase-like protein with peptidoglycan-binding domain
MESKPLVRTLFLVLCSAVLVDAARSDDADPSARVNAMLNNPWVAKPNPPSAPAATAAAGAAAARGDILLRPGDQDKRNDPDGKVLRLQKQLRAAGLWRYAGMPDGVYGMNTQTAVRTFQEKRQKDFGLLPTGAVDAKTQAALDALVPTPAPPLVLPERAPR